MHAYTNYKLRCNLHTSLVPNQWPYRWVGQPGNETRYILQEHLRMLRCRTLRISSLTSAMISSRLSSEGQPAWPVTEILAGYL